MWRLKTAAADVMRHNIFRMATRRHTQKIKHSREMDSNRKGEGEGRRVRQGKESAQKCS